ncbi:MAG: aldehyde dehydrogenase family protein, partial [Bdellovibrionales bacterium]|nr:aldehyde dehydrogenase family protein [Bdellovibrionales bacterium]
RRDQFIGELQELGSSKKSAETEVNHSIDTIVYYAGWADKYQQVFSSVNPVASSHFNFSLYEPMGVIALVAPEDSALLGLVQALMPILTGGNTCTILASESKALCAMSFAEVLHSSDVPAGVVNILTGSRADLLEHMSTHMDVNALVVHDLKKKEFKEVEIWSCTNLKRLITRNSKDFELSPHPILETQELKTTWHPIGT